jgi:hypothetical protein
LNCHYFQPFPKQTGLVQDDGFRLLVNNETAKQTCGVKHTFYLVKETGVLMMEQIKTVPQFSDIKKIMTILIVVDRTTCLNELNV